jgi:hypothetical protein
LTVSTLAASPSHNPAHSKFLPDVVRPDDANNRLQVRHPPSQRLIYCLGVNM